MTAVAKPVHQCGFTLIEVVIAFAIFALCLGAIYETFAGAARRSAQARDQEMIWLLAQSVLAEVRGSASPQDAPFSGRSGEIEWRIEMIPYEGRPVAGADWKAYEVNLRVSGRSSRRTSELRSIEWFRTQP